MFDTPVRNVMQRRKMLKAPPDTSVLKAAKLMAEKNVGAVMVVEDEALVGIFTERDVGDSCGGARARRRRDAGRRRDDAFALHRSTPTSRSATRCC